MKSFSKHSKNKFDVTKCVIKSRNSKKRGAIQLKKKETPYRKLTIESYKPHKRGGEHRCSGVQHYVIKFVSDLQLVGGFLWVLPFPPPIKTDRHDITDILLKVALKPHQTGAL